MSYIPMYVKANSILSRPRYHDNESVQGLSARISQACNEGAVGVKV